LNRNFDFHWAEAGSSGDPCSEIFQGKAPFSEPESRSFRDFMLSPELYGKVDAYITLHTYSQMWIHPWNHEKSSFPNDVADLRSVGIQAVRALESVYGTKYKFGTGADILYPSSGGSDDWAKDTAGVKYVYLLELRPGEQEWDGFILDRNQLIPTGRETWEGVKVVVNAVLHPARAILATTPRPPSPSPNTFRMTAPRQTLEGELRSRLQTQLNGLRRRHFQRRQELQRRSRVENEVMSPLEMAGGGCADSSPWCSTWISANGVVCRSSSIYMRKDCARSCGFCSM